MKISPWLFYLAEVSETARTIALCAGGVSFFLFLCLFCLHYEIEKEGREKLYLSLACATLIICLVTFLTCPSRQTVYQMIIADGLTSEDLEQGFDHSKEVIDYIIEVTNTKGEE